MEESKLIDCPKLIDYTKYFTPDVFKVDTFTSTRYLVKDLCYYFLSISLLCSLHLFTNNWYLYIFFYNVISFVCGFFMWCLFVIAHDCGHGTFSKDNLINNIVGEFVNSGLLLTPWYPWKMSHHLHHLNHNHIKDDYSHVWFISSKKDKVFNHLINRITYSLRWIQPFITWPMYLYLGQPDGGHLFLFGRLWKGKSTKEYARGYLSSCTTLISMYLHYKYVGWIYVLPWIWYGWWLFSVTYLQHHHDGQVVYNKNWNYVDGAMQTIDRSYGILIDEASHHITDCHVVHHLAFTKIPHYHLRKATDQLVKGLKENGLINTYKYQFTGVFDIFPYFWNHWFFIDNVD